MASWRCGLGPWTVKRPTQPVCLKPESFESREADLDQKFFAVTRRIVLWGPWGSSEGAGKGLENFTWSAMHQHALLELEI